MNESISRNKNCQSIFEIDNIQRDINTIVTGVELCKQKIANPTYYGHIEPVIKNTIEQNFDPVISKINVGLNIFLKRLNEEMVVDLRYFNSLESEVDSLTSQLETQRTQFVNEIDRLSREYYYADHMNAILGVYTELDEVTNLQCLDGKLARLLKSSKDLEDIIESQRSEKVKEGLGYNVVPPPAVDLYLSLKKDLSWTGLPEFVDDTVTDYSRPSPTVASTSAEDQNNDTSTSEETASTNPSKPFIKFIKPKDSQPESKIEEQETPKKPQVKNSEQN
nr:hypothetical protein [Tanacetum cinerariifolium]